MKIIPCEGPFGVEIHDLVLKDITDQELAACRQAQREHGVIFFRDQTLSCEDHIQVAARFGEIVINRFFETVDNFPQIAMVRKEPTHDTVVGEDWHTDHSYDQAPAWGSILYAHEVPDSGGDTRFINMHRVFESLSDGLRKTLLSLQAHHSSRHAFGKAAMVAGDERFMNADKATQDSVHPVVIAHPDSGKPVLYVNPDFTIGFVGWTAEESAPLLNYLYEYASREEHVLNFKWRKNSLAFWDNRATWHKAANDYPGKRRLMHRITLAGSELTHAT